MERVKLQAQKYHCCLPKHPFFPFQKQENRGNTAVINLRIYSHNSYILYSVNMGKG